MVVDFLLEEFLAMPLWTGRGDSSCIGSDIALIASSAVIVVALLELEVPFLGLTSAPPHIESSSVSKFVWCRGDALAVGVPWESHVKLSIISAAASRSPARCSRSRNSALAGGSSSARRCFWTVAETSTDGASLAEARKEALSCLARPADLPCSTQKVCREVFRVPPSASLRPLARTVFNSGTHLTRSIKINQSI